MIQGKKEPRRLPAGERKEREEEERGFNCRELLRLLISFPLTSFI